jgi:hypothetical protein
VRCNAVRCSAVRCSAVRCGAVRCGAVRCGAVRGGAVRGGAGRCGAGRRGIQGLNACAPYPLKLAITTSILTPGIQVCAGGIQPNDPPIATVCQINIAGGRVNDHILGGGWEVLWLVG